LATTTEYLTHEACQQSGVLISYSEILTVHKMLI